ncbi:3'(2'),5'-bisphosphate nucleotidase CysQ [Paraburkholderia sp. CNPSo 3274]|uniref:3'(2'),5'-bisphosphate nucleotidase CysQ n=1 Tax=Paraburkholderia sp. CNPSo 3274 TaxID=2940932 RepID=UPI0020B6C93A|nr:3'(2'),5'-bisphosphate nucleotidase CysQ [Paraburkholderia sp. CNPSo 3274]MCP3712607.1 3'(2'),5'-bisphosphate nucleotidase CysQ [Paraburkholderia sp. CNPSo 3274]
MNVLVETLTLDDDHRLAARIATAAGAALNAIRASAVLGGKPLGALGDATANELIARMIAHVRPDDGFLSEESAPDPKRLTCDRVWIIDPLDGTREYGEHIEGRNDWAVHVALAVGGNPDACAVALPALGMTFSTGTPATLPAAPRGQLKILVSRTRAPELARKVAQRLNAELVPMGSAGAKAMAVVRGEAHAYLHAGGQYVWDSCAPVGVALAAGLHASRIDGSPCIYNGADAAMPDLLICRREIAESILAAIAASR